MYVYIHTYTYIGFRSQNVQCRVQVGWIFQICEPSIPTQMYRANELVIKGMPVTTCTSFYCYNDSKADEISHFCTILHRYNHPSPSKR